VALNAEIPDAPEPVPSPTRTGDEDPHWLRDALALPFVAKIRTIGRAVWFLLRAPRAFGEAWYRGERDIPNPLVAMTAAVSILTVLGQETRRLVNKDEPPHSLFSSFLETLGPYAVYIAIGIVAHGVLRLLGSRRKLRTTVGVTLLTGAGAGTLLALGIALPAIVAVRLLGMPSTLSNGLPNAGQAVLIVLFTLMYFYFLAAFELALAGAHGLPRWKGIVAGTVAVFVVAYACGAVEHAAPGDTLGALGPHLSLYFDRHGLKRFGFML
jgi:hypothetical protein